MQATGEAQTFLGKVITFLNQFEEMKITDGTGATLTVLAKDAGDGASWFGTDLDDSTTPPNWSVWFGDATASFIPEDDTTGHIEKFAAEIGTEDTSSYFKLLIGDDTKSNDILFWKDKGHSFRLSVFDYPQIELRDSDNDAGILFKVDTTTPSFILADVYDDPTSGNYISAEVTNDPKLIIATSDHAAGIHDAYLDFDSSKIFLGYDDSQGYKLVLDDGTNACGLHPTFLDFDSSSVFLGNDSGDYKLALTDGTDSCGLHVTYLEVGGVYVGKGSDGVNKFAVGATELIESNLDLGSDGSITIGDNYLPQEISYIGDDGAQYTQWVLGLSATNDSTTGILEALQNVLGADTGDMLIYTGSAWGIINVGSPGDVLMVGSGGYPEWTATSTCGT